jgi:hypothetical protein
MEFTYDPCQTGADVKALFTNAPSGLLIAPFITKAGLLPLLEVLAPGASLDVVTRWEPAEIKAGTSDPMVIDDIEATGGTVRLLPQLHAKLYCVGEVALVGSANVTGPGLGFTTSANVEILVDVGAENEAVIRLLAVVDATASRADRNLAIQLVDYASTIPSMPASVLADTRTRTVDWIPRTMVPSRVMDCYFGSDDRDDYRADLDALDPPVGLSAQAFKTHVGLVLRQGLIGRIFQECEGMQQWQGIEHMRRLLVDAGVEIEDKLPVIWGRLLNWFSYYLGAVSSLNGGYSWRS